MSRAPANTAWKFPISTAAKKPMKPSAAARRITYRPLWERELQASERAFFAQPCESRFTSYQLQLPVTSSELNLTADLHHPVRRYAVVCRRQLAVAPHQCE